MTLFHRPLLLALLAATGAGAFWLIKNSRASTETPKYTVEKREGSFEVRRYAPIQVATTDMANGSTNAPFGRLFRFISGGNARGEKIAMTTPVLIQRAETGGSMSFIVPSAVAAQGVPAPTQGEVKVGEFAIGKVAALRFGGSSNDQESERKAAAELDQSIKAHGLRAKGEPFFAYYDPPWTPSFMRRNEVLIRLDE